MKIKSALATEMSGSLGGLVASHNRGGLYFRARAIPTNPNSPQQQVVRAIVGQLAALWNSTLTALQREAWDTYAMQVPIPDRLGEPRNVGGLAMYIRSNTPRLQISMPRVDDGPVVQTLPGLEALALDSPSEATQLYDIVYIEEPAIPETWLSEDDAALISYSSRGQNLSINYFKGPYRRAGFFPGDSGVPLTPPFEGRSAFAVVQGQRMFLRVQLTRADGRLSLPQFLQATVVNGPAAATDRPAPRPPKEDAPKDDRDPKPKRRKRLDQLVP